MGSEKELKRVDGTRFAVQRPPLGTLAGAWYTYKFFRAGIIAVAAESRGAILRPRSQILEGAQHA